MATTTPAQNIREVQPGEYLCMQGEQSNDIYVLRSGKLQVLVVDKEGLVTPDEAEAQGMLVGEIDRPNSFIGEIGAILKETRSASLRAVEPSQIMMIDIRGRGFEQNILANPKLGFSLARSIASRLALTSNSLTKSDSLSFKSKDLLDNYTRAFHDACLALDEIAQKEQKKMPAVEEAKKSIIYQIGRLSSKYGSVPMDLYSTINLPFSYHIDNFSNRIYMAAPGEKAEEVTGEPKPGVKAFAAGDIVCPEKSVDKTLYILLAGKLEVFVGRRTIEVIQGKGGIFGEMAMFGGQERSSGIRALTDVHSMPIPGEAAEAFLMKKPQLVLHVLRGFAKRLPLLNHALMNTVHQMSLLVDLLGHAANGCITAYELFIPQIKSEAAALGGDASSTAANLEKNFQELKDRFAEIQHEYDAICQEIGYKPSKIEEGAAPTTTMPADEMKIVAKLDDLPDLDSEHINFLFNPKKDLFRACSIEMNHAAMIQRAKIPQDQLKDIVIGRIHNFEERFPQQFITFDVKSAGYGERPRESILKTMQWIANGLEQEAAIAYRGVSAEEIFYIPDHFIKEEEQLVDEATIQEYIEKFKKDPSDRDVLTKLNAFYWDIVINAVLKKLPKVKDDTLTFEDSELKLVNFGLLDEKFLPDNSNVLAQIEEDKNFKPDDLPTQFIYLSDNLKALYREAFGYNKLDKLEAAKKDTEARQKATRDRFAFLIAKRAETIQNFPGGAAALNFVQKMDGMVRLMADLERKMKLGKQLSQEDRGRIVTLKTEKTALWNSISQFLTALKGKVSEDKIQEFRDMGDELSVLALDELNLVDELQRREQDVKLHVDAMRAITPKTKESVYKNEIVRLKKYILLTARKSKIESTSVLVNVRDIATSKRVAEVLKLFLSERVDPYIFDPSLPRIKKDGIPKVMLIPGSGVSVYDWEKHMFLVPLISPKSIEESVANAFVEFHWDMDEDKSMRESFEQIKIYKKLSVTAMKGQLAKDYVTWATKEAKDWKVLDKEVRAWFQTRIAKVKTKKEDSPA
ncbi:MAG: cyclic nucleotide-binding domain-containing protein [bacterium]